MNGLLFVDALNPQEKQSLTIRTYNINSFLSLLFVDVKNYLILIKRNKGF